MTGRVVLFVIMLLGAVNGFWYCATQQPTIGATAIILIPTLSSIVLLVYLVAFIVVNWGEE